MHDEAAHASVPFVSPMKTMSQLSDFFKHSIREWANTIGHKGFISLQVCVAPSLKAVAWSLAGLHSTGLARYSQRG